MSPGGVGGKRFGHGDRVTWSRSVAETSGAMHGIRGRRGTLRPDGLPLLWPERAGAADALARPLAQLRRPDTRGDAASDPADRVRPGHHAFRPGEQLRPAVRSRRAELRQDPQEGLRAVPRRAAHLDQGGLGHVAGSVRAGRRLAQVPARQPRSEPRPHGSRLRRHLLLASVRPGLASRGNDGRARDRPSIKARRCMPASRRIPRA